MSGITPANRTRMNRPFRSLRRESCLVIQPSVTWFVSCTGRPENDDSYVQLDWSKGKFFPCSFKAYVCLVTASGVIGTKENIHEVLYKIVTDVDSAKASKLAYLNCFAKIISKITGDISVRVLGFLPEEIFCW